MITANKDEVYNIEDENVIINFKMLFHKLNLVKIIINMWYFKKKKYLLQLKYFTSNVFHVR